MHMRRFAKSRGLLPCSLLLLWASSVGAKATEKPPTPSYGRQTQQQADVQRGWVLPLSVQPGVQRPQQGHRRHLHKLSAITPVGGAVQEG